MSEQESVAQPEQPDLDIKNFESVVIIRFLQGNKEPLNKIANEVISIVNLFCSLLGYKVTIALTTLSIPPAEKSELVSETNPDESTGMVQ